MRANMKVNGDPVLTELLSVIHSSHCACHAIHGLRAAAAASLESTAR